MHDVPGSTAACPVCDLPTVEVAKLHSEFSQRDFHIRGCESCGLVHVADPRVDFADLYDADYYAGRGADPLVDYIGEMTDARTIRRYEWNGIEHAVVRLEGTNSLDWLDYGCGLGGLVHHVRQNTNTNTNIWGFDDGYSAQWMRQNGLPVLTAEELHEREGSFDVVTAIEVIEHTTDPLALLRHVCTLLKPGGLFFLTTGNSEPHRESFTDWSYVLPDVHVSYFEPRTLRAAYRRVGLEPVDAGFLPGYENIIRYKVLKTLRVRRQNVFEKLVPWRLASRIVDRRHRVTALPLARRTSS